jgi:hypothetical protein
MAVAPVLASAKLESCSRGVLSCAQSKHFAPTELATGQVRLTGRWGVYNYPVVASDFTLLHPPEFATNRTVECLTSAI